MRAILSEPEIKTEATLDDPLPARLWPGMLERSAATAPPPDVGAGEHGF